MGATVTVATAARLPHCVPYMLVELADADWRGLGGGARQRQRERELVPGKHAAQQASSDDPRHEKQMPSSDAAPMSKS